MKFLLPDDYRCPLYPFRPTYLEIYNNNCKIDRLVFLLSVEIRFFSIFIVFVTRNVFLITESRNEIFRIENALREPICVLYFAEAIFPLARADIFQGYCSVNRAKYCSVVFRVHSSAHNFSFEYGFTYFHWTVLKQVARSSVTLRFPIDRTARKVAVYSTVTDTIRDRLPRKKCRAKVRPKNDRY